MRSCAFSAVRLRSNSSLLQESNSPARKAVAASRLRVMPGWLALALFLVLILALVFGRPLLLLAPSLAGMSCLTDTVCTDAPERAGELRTLHEGARRFVDERFPGVVLRGHGLRDERGPAPA